MRLRHKKWTDEVLKNNLDIGKNLSDIDKDTGIVRNYKNLEIGCGLAGFLIELSRRHPENSYLGVEINRNAFAAAVKKASQVKKDQNNFLILNAPIERLFPLFSDGQFDNIYLNFSDPWPKKHQHHRRLTYPTFQKEYVRILNDNGTLYFRSDNAPLFEDSVNYFKETGLFDIEVIEPFYSEKVDYLPPTEYETKFREKGVDIHLLIAHKKI